MERIGQRGKEPDNFFGPDCPVLSNPPVHSGKGYFASGTRAGHVAVWRGSTVVKSIKPFAEPTFVQVNDGQIYAGAQGKKSGIQMITFL